MFLELRRKELMENQTTGELWINGAFECYTLEDVVRSGPKVFAKTAIPQGTYSITMNLSPKFKKILPRLERVPGFTGILIHGGNTHEDTSGCILVGDELQDGRIKGGTSTPAIKRLVARLAAIAAAKEAIQITVSNEFPQEPKP